MAASIASYGNQFSLSGLNPADTERRYVKKCEDDASIDDCALLFANLKVGLTNAQDKVFVEKPFEFAGGFNETGLIRLAGNEYEALQLVLFSRQPETVSVRVNDLRQSDGSAVIAAADNIEINVVAHIGLEEAKVPRESRKGWHPDPLLKNQPIELRPGHPQAFLITVYAPPAIAAGNYQSEIIVSMRSGRELAIPLRVEVWGFELPKGSRFKTTVLADWATPDEMWPNAMGYPKPSNESRKRHMLRLADLGFRNRLPPTAYLANGLLSWNWKGEGDTRLGYPTHDKHEFNAERTLELIRYMRDKGANHFFIALTSDIYELEKSAAYREAVLRRYLQDYRGLLQAHDLSDMAYIYGVDEPWGDAVERARRTYTFVKENGGQGIRLLQNTNQDNGRIIGELLGFFDALDINLGWYEKTRLHNYRKSHPKALGEVWWNVNLWPDSHPNLFLEYPLTDARIIGPMSYKFGIQGFEYWDVLAKTGIGNYYPLPPDELYVDWKVGKNSLDGTLVYPGENYEIYSSLRYESLRDGFEDLEYLYLLESLDPDHPLLEVPIVKSIDNFETDPEAILDFRRQVAEAILKKTKDYHGDTEEKRGTEGKKLNQSADDGD